MRIDAIGNFSESQMRIVNEAKDAIYLPKHLIIATCSSATPVHGNRRVTGCASMRTVSAADPVIHKQIYSEVQVKCDKLIHLTPRTIMQVLCKLVTPKDLMMK